MYLRFVVFHNDDRTGKRMGILSAAYKVLRELPLPEYQESSIRSVLQFFERELPIPDRFSKNRFKDYYKNMPGISWLKSENAELVCKFYELKAILDDLGLYVDCIKRDYPGRIVYEDYCQVVAI